MGEPAFRVPDEFPEELLKEYRVRSCLRASEGRSTFLCQRLGTDEQVIIKVQPLDGEISELANEDRLLREIRASGNPAAELFPRAVRYAVFGKTEALIRSYIRGQSVASYVESAPAGKGVSRDWSAACIGAVLSQAAFLHHMHPPVIHRDIKPQNVIVDPEGRFHLIDFGISRRQKPEKAWDTRVMGTSATAPPEQFGFRQTDARSDIYAVGMLLRYCLTQEYREEADALIDPDMRAVIEKATQFDPDARYQRAEEMQAALRETGGLRRKKGRFLWAAALLLVLIAAGFAALRTPVRQTGVYRFREPLLEEAVRQALGKPGGDLTYNDLAQMTSIYIFGRQIYADDAQFCFLGDFVLPYDPAVRASGLWTQNGGIRTLEDVRAMPNLRQLCLYRQEISDLSPLSGSGVERLGIGMNPVGDLSALEGNLRLTYLNVNSLPVSDAAQIASMKRLTGLVLAGTRITEISALSGLNLKELNLVDVDLRDGRCLREFAGLEKLTVSKLYPGLLSQLTGLPLRDLMVTHAQEDVALRSLEGLPMLERLSYSSDSRERIDGLPLRFPGMRELEIKNGEIESLTCVSAMPQLRVLSIQESECLDVKGLENLAGLTEVRCTEDQKRMLEAEYPGAAWLK